MNILSRSFYSKNSLELSQELLGKIFVHEIEGNKVGGRIVEVEAYMGIEDKAAHSYGGKRTKRTEVMYGLPGLLYVYLIYGMYNCANIVAGEKDVPQAVLIRAIEPIYGLDQMAHNRFKKSYSELSKKQKILMVNGPGKLCMAMGINKELNGIDLCKSNLYLLDDGYKAEVLKSKRIGIDYAEEAADFLWRFYLKDNIYVSVKG